jgi:tetratricopeptide (TPR) repeat protein
MFGGAPAAADPPAESTRRGQGNRSQAPGQAAAAALSTQASWRLTFLGAGVIVLAAVAAYHNSFVGTYAYDDQGAIVDNPTIRRLWPIGPVLSPPPTGETVSGRPLLNLTLAINYAISTLDVWSYHVTNLLIHVAAALLLFGILRRTFLMPALRDRFGTAAMPLALASALIWTVHPLQTESVTYIVQRAESLAGMFYLLTLYCVIRGAGEEGVRNLRVEFPAPSPTPSLAPSPLSLWERVRVRVLVWKTQTTVRVSATSALTRSAELAASPALSQRERGILGPCPLLWYPAAVAACLLGTACKEILITAPLVVLLYDRTFLAGSFAVAWRRRWGLYLALAASWGLLAYLVFSTGLIARQSELGAPDAWSYARSEPGVILYYLRLSVWPRPLCMSYQWPVANTLAEILPGAIVIGLLLAATLWGLVRWKTWGFWGAWFFLILAPTSTIMPLNQLAHEHRMYLSLAAVVVLAVVSGYALCERLLPTPGGRGGQFPFSPGAAQGKAGLWAAKKGTVPAAKKGTVPSLATIVRWAAPAAVLAGVLTALAWATVLRNSDYHSAIAIWQDAVDKRPNNPVAHNNLGNALAIAGSLDEAIQHYREALRVKPDHVEAHLNLGNALDKIGRTNEAIAHYEEALRLRPDDLAAHNGLGLALAGVGRTSEAIEHFHRVLELKPDHVQARNNLGNTLAKVGRTSEAIEQYEQAVRLKPDDAAVHNNLAVALADLKRTDDAIAHYREAVRLKPDYFEARYNLADALVKTGRADEAIEHFRAALRLRPSFAVVHLSLANALASVGRRQEAVPHYIHLAWMLATRGPAEGGDPARAVQFAERARQLSRHDSPECFDTLAAAYAAAGRFDDAVTTAEQAVRLAESAGQTPLAKKIRSRLELYRAGQPYREGLGIGERCFMFRQWLESGDQWSRCDDHASPSRLYERESTTP